MRVTAKLVAIVMIGVVVLLLADAYVSAWRETQLYEFDMQRNAQLLGTALAGFVDRVWQTSGPEDAKRLIDQANRHENVLHIRWISYEQYRRVMNLPAGRDLPRHRPVSVISKNQGTAVMLT